MFTNIRVLIGSETTDTLEGSGTVVSDVSINANTGSQTESSVIMTTGKYPYNPVITPINYVHYTLYVIEQIFFLSCLD